MTEKLDSLGSEVLEDADWTFSFDERMDIEELLTLGASESRDTISKSLADSKDEKRKSEAIHGPSRRSAKKKRKGIPKRPLSAYNLFFHKERIRLHESTVPRLSFEELGKAIGKNWRELTGEDRKVYEQLADEEVERYRVERDAFEASRRMRFQRESKKDLLAPSPSAFLSANQESVSATQLPSIRSEGFVGPETCLPQAMPYNPISGMNLAQVQHFPSVFLSVAGGSEATMPQPSQHMRPTLSRGVPSFSDGLEVVLPDGSGLEKRYKIQYASYRMTRSEAEAYTSQFTQYIYQFGRPSY